MLDESWPKFLAKAGMGGIAIFLVYQLSVTISGHVSDTHALMLAHVRDVQAQTAASDLVMRQLVNVTVQQCVNAASDRAERDACFLAVLQAPTRDPR
jgi:hypothetical protein